MIYLSLILLALQSWHAVLDFLKGGMWNRPCKASWELGFGSRVKSGIFPGSSLCIPIGGHWTLYHSMVHSVLGWSELRSAINSTCLERATSKIFLEGQQSWDRWHEAQVLHATWACPARPWSGLLCALGTCQRVAQAMLTPVWLKPYT